MVVAASVSMADSYREDMITKSNTVEERMNRRRALQDELPIVMVMLLSLALPRALVELLPEGVAVAVC